MAVFRLVENILGLGKAGHRVVVQNAGEWSMLVCRPVPYDPGLLLNQVMLGHLIPDDPASLDELRALVTPLPVPPAESPPPRVLPLGRRADRG